MASHDTGLVGEHTIRSQTLIVPITNVRQKLNPQTTVRISHLATCLVSQLAWSGLVADLPA
jgi:hypothetical protein